MDIDGQVTFEGSFLIFKASNENNARNKINNKVREIFQVRMHLNTNEVEFILF